MLTENKAKSRDHMVRVKYFTAVAEPTKRQEVADENAEIEDVDTIQSSIAKQMEAIKAITLPH